MKHATGQKYRQRLIRVIDYIHDNLDADLDVDKLAEVAMMSPYHFHRIYRLMTHETVNATVRRLRLHSAAVELIRSEKPLSEIATRLTYGSLEAFSRAFTKEFGQAPSDYRRAHKHRNPTESEPYIAMLPLEQSEAHDDYEVDILKLDQLHLAAYPHQGDYSEIGSAFERLSVYAASIGLFDNSSRSFGLYYDDPASTETKELRAHACINIEPDAELSGDGPPQKMTIPDGRYASLVFKGSYAELEAPYNYLFGEWLPNSGYEAGDFPPIEEYLNDVRDTPPSELLTRIHCLILT